MRAYAAAYKERTGKVLWKQYRPEGSPSGGWIGQRRRLAIYERDAWTCRICDQPVDTSDPNGDLAPSLDHVVPRSQGGTHDDDNLRCAHRACNSRRGAPALV
jgi:5-methylcytosine-specific restriction endonuclease McrA